VPYFVNGEKPCGRWFTVNSHLSRARGARVVTAALAVVASAATLTPATPASATTTHPDYITLLVGSPRTAVYELTHDPNTDTVPPTGAPYELVARGADGSSDEYPLSDAQASLMRWSLSQAMLTALDSSDRATVTWWNLATHTSGTLVIPAHSYVSASPDGVLFLTKGGDLKDRTATGLTTVLSRPFAKRPRNMTGRANDTAVVIGDYPGQARYLSFAQPTQVRRLRTGNSEVVVCDALGAKYAACTTWGVAGGRPSHAALLSLTGKAPMSVGDRRENFGGVGLIGRKTAAWTRFGKGTNSDGSPRITVGSLTHGSDHRVVASGVNVAFGQVITAYGQILVMPRKRHRIFASSNGTTFGTIVTAPTG
jgi:hypothetical protein